MLFRWEPPASAGELNFSSAKKASDPKWALALELATPALKRMIKLETFSGALKRSFPRINAGAPTEKGMTETSPGALKRPSPA
jgi:hypothetical protein